MAAPEITIRPVRPADRERVLEMVADVWDGHDYIPRVFDDWVAQPAASFQAAELEGLVVGLQRLRPFSERVVYYEGLRVASTHRKLGIARAMLEAAIRESREQGFEVLRLSTGNPDAVKLFESAGFQLKARLVSWAATRVEGGDPPRMAAPEQASGLLERLRADPAFAAYAGINFDWASGPRDLDLEEMQRLIASGQVRVGAGARSLAVVRVGAGTGRLIATLVAGSGGAFQDLLMALRFEADSQDLESAAIFAPRDHPSADDFQAVGYDLPDDEDGFTIYELRLRS